MFHATLKDKKWAESNKILDPSKAKKLSTDY